MSRVLVESPGAYLHARRATGNDLLSYGAAAAAAVLVVTSSGDLFFVVALLGLATFDAIGVGLAGAAATAMLLRWGSSSLAAIAGGQAVLGAGIAVGPITGAVATAAAALTILCAGRPGITAIPFGLTAAVLVAGPAATTPSRFAIRAGAATAGALLALLATRRVDGRTRRRVGLVAGATALVGAALT